MTKHIFCCNKSMLVATKVCLSWQNILVMTKLWSRQIFVTTNNFVVTKVLSRQAYFCRYKHMFVVTKDVFRCNKTSLLSRQKYAYYSKTFIATKMILMAAPTNDKEEGCWKAILGVCIFLFSSSSSTNSTLHPSLAPTWSQTPPPYAFLFISHEHNINSVQAISHHILILC